MVNYHFLYKSSTCEEEELETRLNQHGAEGWRLHTCEPFVIQGVVGVGSLKYAVVMDLGPIPNEEPEELAESTVDKFAGIPMR